MRASNIRQTIFCGQSGRIDVASGENGGERGRRGNDSWLARKLQSLEALSSTPHPLSEREGERERGGEERRGSSVSPFVSIVSPARFTV